MNYNPECPFCGCDPYEYVDVGVGGGGVPVAVTCCDLGIEYFDNKREEKDFACISFEDLDRIANLLRGLRGMHLPTELARIGQTP